MKYANFIARPMSVTTFLDSALDDDDTNTNDWREKARQLRLRRWRKITEHGQAVSDVIRSSRSYHRLHQNLGSKHSVIAKF